MPVEKDLKEAYSLLYDKIEVEKALELYDKVLKQDPNSLNANVYKSVCLEKLYFRSSSWHNEETLQASYDFLKKALDIAERRGDRSKIGFVYFRFCIHYYNCKKYCLAQEFMQKCESYGFKDDTLPMWKHNIDTAIRKHVKKDVMDERAKAVRSPETDRASSDMSPSEAQKDLPTLSQEDKLKMDWYQSSSTVTLSLFTKNLPNSKSDVNVSIKGSHLSISYPIPDKGSEFQYSIMLSHNVDPTAIQVSVFTKKLEVTLGKAEQYQWKSLEKTDGDVTPLITKNIINSDSSAKELSYPSSSKKAIDWSKIDIDSDEQDSKNQSADAFFQQIYKGADEDTRRAMMKSFIESNGTSLSTNWEEVSKGKVEPALPEGVEMKKL